MRQFDSLDNGTSPQAASEAANHLTICRRGFIKRAYRSRRITNHRVSPVAAAFNRRQNFTPASLAKTEAGIQVRYVDVDDPLRRQPDIASPGVANAGYGLFSSRPEHIEIAISSHVHRLRRPTCDTLVKRLKLIGIPNRKINPTDDACI